MVRSCLLGLRSQLFSPLRRCESSSGGAAGSVVPVWVVNAPAGRGRRVEVCAVAAFELGCCSDGTAVLCFAKRGLLALAESC